MQNPLASRSCHKNDFLPHTAARDTHESLLRENWWGYKKMYQDLFYRRNSHKVGKKQVHEDSSQSVQDLQSSLIHALVAWRSPPLLCPTMNKGQSKILTYFDQAMYSEIRRSNDAQLERAIADFFYCENTANRVVESTRFKYMLKKAQLRGGVSFSHQGGKKWR